MSQATPEEEIALLNTSKQVNVDKIKELNKNIISKQTLIDDYTAAIAEFEQQIIGFESSITTLEYDNTLIDDIIVKITPVQKSS